MSTTTEATIANDYTTILARTGSEAEIQSWVSVVDSGALTLAQVESAFIASPEAQQDVVPIIELYQTELNRAPDAAGLAAWVGAEKAGVSLTQIAADIANSAESQALYGDSTAVNTAFLTALYQTALGRAPDTAGLNAWLNSGLTQAQIEYAFATSPEAVARITPAADAFLASVAEGGPYGGSLFAAAPGGTFTLTSGVDNLALTGNNNTVNGTANGSNLTTAATFNTGDSIEGATGSTGNVLNLADIGEPGFGSSGTWDPTNLAGVTVSGIQTLNLDSTEAVDANTATSVEGFTGLTALNVQDSGGSNVTAAGTTAISITDLNAGGASEDVNGGSSVGVTTQGETTGRISIGSTVAPTGTVTVVDSSSPTAGSAHLGTISVAGGTVVSVTENELGAVNNTVTGGTVTVSGSAATTSVSVTQTAPATHSPTATGVVDGKVAINDMNGTSLTEAGTITSVSLNNYGSGATITDNALANLTLAGTGGGVTIADNLTTPMATTLNLSVNGLTDTTGITDAKNEITTLNVVTGGTTASTLGLFNDFRLATLNVSGTQAFNLVMPSTSATLTAINVSGGASLSSGLGVAYALGTNTTFTSTSTGTDLVSISGPATKAVTGNGSANEEIVWDSTSAPVAGTGYLGKVTGFSVLGVGSAAADETFDMSKLTGFSSFDVEANPDSVTLTNVAAGSPLAIDGAFGGTLTYQTADTAGATDSLAVTLGAATNTDGFTVNNLILEDSQLNGIGNLTVTSNASASAAFSTITTLTDPSLSSLTVAGTGGLAIADAVNTNAASLTIDGTSTGTAPITIGNVNDANLTTLNLGGSDTLGLGTVTGSTSGVTVNGSADNAGVTVTLVGAQASGTDTIGLGNGTNSVVDNTGSTKATVDVTVGTGANNVVLGNATNNVTFGAHSTTTVDNVSVSGSVDSTIVPSALITGLNAAGADTITFTSDALAAGPINTYTATQINQFGIDTPTAGTGTPPTTLAGAVADVLASTGGNLAQHAIGEFQFQNNTYFVEQAGATGSAFGAGDTVVQLGGLNTFTTATNATGGILHLVG